MGKMSGSHCLVMGCRNRQLLNQTNTRSYFRFPRDAEMCKQWVDFCNRPELWKKYDENGPEYLYKSSRICSDHFQPSDFNNPNLFSQGLKKGSVPTLYPASKEPKNRYSIGGSGISAISGIGFAGGGGSGNNSPPNTNNDNDSLVMPMSTKRPLLSQPSAQQPVAKQRRSLPPALGTATNNNHAAAVSGVLAGLIQRQQLKEQQRKAFAAALQLQQRHQHQQQQVQPNPQRSLLASLKQKPNTTTTTTNNNNNNSSNNNNNNNHISSNNNNNNTSSAKLAAATLQERLEDERGYGINYVDMDGGDSSEYESSYQNAVDEELAAYKQLQQMKAIKAAAAVIPASLKSELTVTPAVNHNNNHSKSNTFNKTTSSISASPPSSSSTNGTINYKEKYEQTLKELFACRKIVKNQNNAIKQLQGEIDFLNQLLKEK
ncbi:putative uncharacterized protein DDB_G0282129 isoform X1 [Ochlerotatus camptorhynchus]|uniref:putative uncharacterized protein DDB_G0282129 isoform X1 n=1 Tax=Ochlerotatus camptorhynchus TaxID=644619 RepID=UPI0031D83F17